MRIANTDDVPSRTIADALAEHRDRVYPGDGGQARMAAHMDASQANLSRWLAGQGVSAAHFDVVRRELEVDWTVFGLLLVATEYARRRVTRRSTRQDPFAAAEAAAADLAADRDRRRGRGEDPAHTASAHVSPRRPGR